MKKSTRLLFKDVLNVGIEKFDTKYTMAFDLAGKRRLGRVIKFNDRTVIVKVMKGAKTFDIIKRHNKKHRVDWVFLEGE